MKKRFLAIVLLLAITCALCVSANASPTPASALSSSYTTVNLTTADGSTVSAKKYSTDLTDAEKADINSDADLIGAYRISGASILYNCHSYAWHKMSVTNTYWISYINSYLNDTNCTEISSSQLQRYDIVVYYVDGAVQHSAVIYNIADNGTLTLRSKWGRAGVYEHTLSQVPSSYLQNGTPNVRYYRYHDFAARYTGNNYHSKGMHYLEYIDTCAVCGLTQGSAFWTSAPCSGPPCNTPLSLPDDEVAA